MTRRMIVAGMLMGFATAAIAADAPKETKDFADSVASAAVADVLQKGADSPRSALSMNLTIDNIRRFSRSLRDIGPALELA